MADALQDAHDLQAEGVEDGLPVAPRVNRRAGQCAADAGPLFAELHRELGRLGYRSGTHYALAEQALERPVSSLAALSAEEAATVRSYAYGQLGLATGSVAA
ncbi:hypothetical protein [Deinococcus sp. YIM 77859]|uniref:hypothetical protein n=1 Tax=Deinococcus sp. YIM 77859 TaxID=1540221 RepID=UPI000AC16049|nr:hypothetical protein [Deinococcus sp. YIM 77859]